MFIAEIRRHGFDRTFDFIYMPMDLRTRCNMGYCFVNFVDEFFAREFYRVFEGMGLASFNSYKVLSIHPATTRGLYANMSSFQNRSKEIPPEYQPLIFNTETGMEILREQRVPSRADPIQQNFVFNSFEPCMVGGNIAMMTSNSLRIV